MLLNAPFITKLGPKHCAPLRGMQTGWLTLIKPMTTNGTSMS
ncbi:Hypothetical protein RAK1035_2166 [Roseovarius sp. AK1035]|nr:Hypothetical protein RAK1035_2166 [Roseovarius sp. AK1035]